MSRSNIYDKLRLKKVDIFAGIDKEILIDLYKTHSKVFLAGTTGMVAKGLFLDMSKLTPNIRDIFITWMIYVNRDRLAKEQEPIMTLELALKCPIWKLVDAPVVSIQLTKEALRAPRRPRGSIGSKRSIGSINKR